ncbi:IclR family transcriptional regulator [Microbacterium sp. CPCC 204701]|uniref:IclR family transcriptional regulator n=1 Tax=Microbacterium sp. CPCC 204701 TaxID=2493084 RepID=UPI000FD7D756|nr:IclR family transcriptional regulator [Microbacterium sp. CPCC 204701]
MRNPTLDSVVNALRVVQMFRTNATLTVTQVAKELDVAKSTAHRLLSTLVTEGFAERDPLKRVYHPGATLVAVGLSSMGTFDVQRRANQPMADAAARIGETVKLLVLQGRFSRCISSIEAEHALQVGGGIGRMLPVHATAGGKILLQNATEDHLRRLFPTGLPALTEHTITDFDDLMVELQATRKRRWATSRQESTVGVDGVAVAVTGVANKIVAALAVAAPSARMNPTRRLEIARELLEAAERMRANRADAATPA